MSLQFFRPYVPPFDANGIILSTTLISFFFVVGFVGNVLTIAVIMSSKQLRSVKYFRLFSFYEISPFVLFQFHAKYTNLPKIYIGRGVFRNEIKLLPLKFQQTTGVSFYFLRICTCKIDNDIFLIQNKNPNFL